MEEANAMEPQKEPQAETPEEFNVQADEEGGETPAEREETEAWLRDPEGGEETAGPSFLSWVGAVLLLLVPTVNLAYQASHPGEFRPCHDPSGTGRLCRSGCGDPGVIVKKRQLRLSSFFLSTFLFFNRSRRWRRPEAEGSCVAQPSLWPGRYPP